MRFGVVTNKGIVRDTNEDNYNIISGYPEVPVSFVIADGMGGHNSGEVASKIAVDSVSSYILQSSGKFSEEAALEIIGDIIKKANNDVYSKSKEDDALQGMGTTLITAVFNNKMLYIGHVGDSRAYIIRDGAIERITVDHSYIEELIQSGSITREEAENHPKKNVITRALGCSEEIKVDTYSIDVSENDLFLLCTDGLTNMLSENEILDIVQRFEEPEEACIRLVNLANEKGGEDNITVIIFKN